MKYIIKDWTGTVMNFGTFNHMDDASSFLVEKFEYLSDEELEVELGEYSICEVE